MTERLVLSERKEATHWRHRWNRSKHIRRPLRRSNSSTAREFEITNKSLGSPQTHVLSLPAIWLAFIMRILPSPITFWFAEAGARRIQRLLDNALKIGNRNQIANPRPTPTHGPSTKWRTVGSSRLQGFTACRLFCALLYLNVCTSPRQHQTRAGDNLLVASLRWCCDNAVLCKPLCIFNGLHAAQSKLFPALQLNVCWESAATADFYRASLADHVCARSADCNLQTQWWGKGCIDPQTMILQCLQQIQTSIAVFGPATFPNTFTILESRCLLTILRHSIDLLARGTNAPQRNLNGFQSKYVLFACLESIPILLHKAVAEASKRGNPQNSSIVVMHGLQNDRTETWLMLWASLSLYLAICLPSICLSISPTTYVYFSLSLSLSLSLFLSRLVSRPMYLFVCLSKYLASSLFVPFFYSLFFFFFLLLFLLLFLFLFVVYLYLYTYIRIFCFFAHVGVYTLISINMI